MEGTITRIAGPVVEAKGMRGVKLNEVVRVGNEKLIGEVIRIDKDIATIQVYEETSGLMPSEPVFATGRPLCVELGPGLLGSIYDGIQRPLDAISAKHGSFIPRGVEESSLNRKKKWAFKPVVKNGENVKEGQIIGKVMETPTIEHKILAPLGLSGKIKGLEAGEFTVDEPIAEINGQEIKMMQTWPVKKARPYVEKLEPYEPLITGQRVIDFLFPIAKGGTAAIPGPFGSGKCVVGSTVIFADNRLTTIEKLFEDAKKTNMGKIFEDEKETIIELNNPIIIQTFDGKKIRSAIATHLYKGKTEMIIEIKTSSGRFVQLTPLHKLLVLDKNLKIKEIEAMHLKKGDFVLAPRKMELQGAYQQIGAKFDFSDESLDNAPRYLDEELAELLGYFLSHGSIRNNKTVSFYSKSAETRNRIKFLLTKIFNFKPKEQCACADSLDIQSRPIVQFFKQFCSQNSQDVPKELFSSPESVIKSFLIAYISDSYHISENELEIEIPSNELACSLSYLLVMIGVVCKIKEEGQFRISIPQEEAVKIVTCFSKEHVGFADVAQASRISCHCVNRNRTITVQNIIEANAEEALAEALEHVFCDMIEEIKAINRPMDVFDITVPETHNFIGGNAPLILHNTVIQHQLAKWTDADIVVYVGCGERGNEMTDVLTELPKLVDQKTGRPLMERSVLIANTSNMPVAAREASVYTGITIAEYYRDQGFNVALMADSTSRWAEALREVSSRLEEMPGEEGYPAYLASRIASFYERSGRVKTLADNLGSISVIGAVSPPGGDFSEPVTQNTLRVTKVFWALDANLASRRHFPAINWLSSYSLYAEKTDEWFAKNVNQLWPSHRINAMKLLQREAELLEIVQIVGPDALPEKDRLTMLCARMIREDFLQQSAFHEIDSFCDVQKQFAIIDAILFFYEETNKLVSASVKEIEKFKSLEMIARLKYLSKEDVLKEVQKIKSLVKEEVSELSKRDKTFGVGR